MATEGEQSCPICRNAEDDVAYVTPCLHQFCLGCIVRWAKRRPSCPLCRQPVSSIIYSVQSEDDFLRVVLPRPSGLSVDGRQDEQGAAGPVPRTHMAGFQPEVWASLFRGSLEILEPLLAWMNQELWVLFGAHWWQVAAVVAIITVELCRYGLDEEALVRNLQPFLQHQTVTFVRQLIDVAADRCGEQILRQLELLDSPAAEEQEDRPTATPSPAASPGGNPVPNPGLQEEPHAELGRTVAEPSTAGQGGEGSPGGPRQPQKRRASGSQASPAHKRTRGPAASSSSRSCSCTSSRGGTPGSSLASSSSPASSDAEDQPSSSVAALRGGPTCPPSAPVPAEQEQPQEEPGEVVALAGPSAQACSCGPSAPDPGGDRSHGGPRKPQKRRASGSQASPAHKRPCRRQH